MKFFAEDQSAVFKIKSREHPLEKAAETAAERQEWALDLSMSIPEFNKTSLSQRATVLEVTGL